MNPNDISQDPLNFDEEDDLLAAEDRLHEDDEPKGPSLNEIIKNNPSLKIFGVVLVIGIFLIVFLVFGSGDEPNPSVVSSGNTVSQPPGTSQLPPAYEDAVRSASEQRAENAELTGGSALPTPIGTPERIEAPPAIENTDPLAEWRQAAETRANERREQINITEPANVQPITITEPPPTVTTAVAPTPPPAPPPLPTGPTDQDIQAMSQRFTQQMQTVLEAQVPTVSVVMGQNVPTGFEVVPENVRAQQQQAAAQAAAAQQAAPPKVIISAGTVGYAQTLIEANSDIPSPVLAELASGPLTGARLIGNFQMVSNRYLTLRFNQAIYKGRSYTIDTYALDPETTLAGMATDIDRHYVSRILIPAAAKFLQGYAQAVAQRGTQVVVNNSSTIATQEPLDGREQAIQGASEAMNQVSTVVQNDLGNRPVTVKVAAGTRIGLLFLTSVTEANADQVPQNVGYQNQLGQNSGSTLMNDPRIARPPEAQGATIVQPTATNNMTGSDRPFLQQTNSLR